MTVEAQTIAENIARVRERIARAAERCRRSAEDITLVAVSKTFPAEVIRAAYEAGVRHFGENRVQEFEGKREKLRELVNVKWHMIGHIQGNKARRVAELFGRVDSLDRFSVAEKLDTAIAEGAAGRQLPVLIEVKLSGEETKSGVEEAGLVQLAEDVLQKCSDLELRGLMTIPPYAEDQERSRVYFRRLRELRDGLQQKIGRALPALSMGMTHDYEVAIEEGATEVRIGTAIFGARPRAR